MEATETDIKTTRERAKFFGGRIAALTAQLADAETNETAALDRLDASRAGLTHGAATADDIARNQRALGDASGVVVNVREALVAAQREADVLRRTITEYETAQERAKQEADAQALRDRAAAQLSAFVQALADVSGPLRAYAQLAAEVRERFPMATAIPPAHVGNLADAIRSSWTGSQLRTRDAAEWALWLVHVLAGPLPEARFVRTADRITVLLPELELTA